VRTFTLLASEVVGAPYRPDAFRAPICWKFFGKSRLSDFTLEERLVEAAERLARDRIDSLNAFLDRPAFVALPLFLTRVLAESSDRSQLVPIALQIRDSGPARRFREYGARLRIAVEEGEIAEVARGLDRYARLLRDEFGRQDDGAEVLWSLAASGAKAAILQDPASITGLATEAGARGGKAAARWWSNASSRSSRRRSSRVNARAASSPNSGVSSARNCRSRSSSSYETSRR
jgi:hypothetical protein